MQVKYKEGTPIADHLNEFQGYVNKSSGMSIKFEGKLLGLWLMITLSNYWKVKRITIFNIVSNGVCKNVENKENKADKAGDKERASVVTNGDLWLACEEDEVVNLTEHRTDWVVDIGVSLYATSRKGHFISYTPGDYGVLRTGNEATSQAVGRGYVSLIINNGTRLLLRDVRCALDIHMNLFSVGRLDDEGFCNTFCEWV
ncbi:hypothetical protein Nepgr_028678 [Nepenthes gracilis]|uniref:Retrovirus-related Pol polyprotein from transposon TNT 1-94-like beta-barrel domain-containing protein n=1 Tax=Nepenthes gracilis TaxID=150966 RepID=A0AAD3Y465_NEPGR|nr:hypothetical protein Nepgr_028678 [Nepenthes gracilis]